MITPSDIDTMIKTLIEQGVSVFDGKHVIYASKFANFLGSVYPLKIVLVGEDQMPAETVCIISTEQIEVEKEV